MPSMELSELVKQLDDFGAVNTEIQINAVLASNGKVIDVAAKRPMPGARFEPWAKKRSYRNTVSGIIGSKELTDELVAAATNEVRQVRFTPKMVSGLAHPDRIIAKIAFHLAKLPVGAQGTRCDFVRMTVNGESGILSDGPVWQNGCIVY